MQIDQATVRHRAPKRVKTSVQKWIVLGGALSALGAASSVAHADGAIDSGANDWAEYNYDHTGSRYNAAESTLSPASVTGLHVKWTFKTPLPVTGTPVVANDIIYAGDMTGMFYALNRSGALLWSRQLSSAVTASALVTDSAVIIGDLAGNVWGLHPTTGAVLWTTRPDAHPVAAIWGSATKVGKNVAIGIASNEESATLDPNYTCCSTRGSLVLLDPTTGATIWQTFMITDAQRASGSSGASIWSTPTYDAGSGTIYVSTGNNFSEPTTATSDAIAAVDAKTGAIRWVSQQTKDDEWNYRFPTSSEHPDFDFGDSPQVYRLSGGRQVVAAGQKSGFYHVLDAATGQVLQQTQVEVGGPLGGLFADTAVANGTVFANGIDWPDTSAPPTAGDVVALSGDGSQELWRFHVPYSPSFGGVAVANSVVYFTMSYSQTLFALDTATGAVLAAVPVGISDSGPSVSRGQVYVGTGDALAVGFGVGSSTGSITALGL